MFLPLLVRLTTVCTRGHRFLAAYLPHCKMSVAKKEEVCGHPRRLGEPAVGVPIKKRPVFLSDKSVPSGMALPMKPSSTATGISVSATGAGCSKEPFLNRSKSDIPNRSVTPFASEKNGVLLNFSSENPSCGESDRGRSVAPIVKSQSQKFLTLDLQLTSRQNSKISSSPVKKEKVGQVFSIFPSARPPKDIQTTINMESPTNSSLRKLSNLDLNVSLDPVDHHEGLPAMHTSSNGLYHRTFQHQKAQVPLVAPISTTSSRLSLNIDSTVNLSNTCQLSFKSGEDDVTLDLQLKPPTRPVLGISWKGLAPAPELSLSLFGNHTDEPKDPSYPDAMLKPEPVERAKKMSGEVATPGSDKSPVEKILKPVPCNANPHITLPSTTVPGNVNLMSSTLVKKEPEEPSRQHIQKNAEKAPLFEQQTVGLVSNCAEFEKTGDVNQVLGKASFDLNSEILRNYSIHNGLEVVTDNVPAQTNRSCDVVCTENMPAVSDVEKFIKQEEITADTPSPVIATASGQPVLSIAKSLLLEGNVGRPAVGSCESAGQPIIIAPAVGSCESASQPTIHTSEPACCNPVEASTDCKPTVSHVHARENMTYKSCGAKEVCDISRSSSKPLAKSLVLNCLDRASFDVMSQGSASMDCSDDGDNVVSQLPITSNPHVELLGNSQITEANNLSTELRKGDDIDMHHDCSSVKNKVHTQGIDNVKHVNTKDVIATLSCEEEHESEVSVNGKSKDKQLLASDKSSPPNNTDVAMQDVKIATGASSADLKMSSALETSASPEIVSTGQSHNTFDNCAGKSRIPVIKSERSQSPDGKQAANCSEGNAKIAAVAVKIEHGTENEEIARTSNLHPSDSILAEDSHLDRASSSQPHSECTKSKSACEGTEHEKSKPDSCMTSSVQNEKDGQVNVSHWREVANACVNRNERWERFMQSEREKHNEEYHGGRHASDMINQRRTDHRNSGRGAGYHGHPRNFQGPRMNDESEVDFTDGPMIGRRRPFEDGIGHLHRVPHRRLRSPPNQMSGCLMRDMDHDRFSGRDIPDPRLLAHGQMEDFPDDMMEESFFIHHPQHALGDHPFIRRDRSHSPEQRRGGPMHFHRGRSPEATHRPPPLNRTYLPHQRHTRRRGSLFDQIGRDERGTQRNMRRCGLHGVQGVQDDGFEPSLHPAQLAELHAEAELAERRKFGERRVYRRSLEESPTGNEEMLSYHGEGDMHFTEGDWGQREADGRFRNKLEHRARGEQEDGYRHRGPQGWRDGNSNDSRPKKRRY